MYSNGGFQLLGRSLGGLVAFGAARRLAAAGAHVGQVVMLDTSVPCVMPPPPENEIIRPFSHDLPATMGTEPIAGLGGLLVGAAGQSAPNAISPSR